MEFESETRKTKISDSAYSISFYKSNSHSSASSKSILSGSQFSSGYGGAVKAESVDINATHKYYVNNKENDNRKNKSQLTNMSQNHVMPSESTAITNDCDANPSDLRLEECSKTDIIDIRSTKGKNNCTGTALASSAKPIDCSSTIDDKNTAELENAFSCIISMYDGIVLYTSSSLTSLLGFPKNMWLGRSFCDFLHPKDKDLFCSQVTNGIAIPIAERTNRRKDVKASFYVFLQKYRGLKTSEYNVSENKVSYQAFNLSVTIKNANENVNPIFLPNDVNTFLNIVAIPVYSSYSVPNQVKKSNIFGMRHTATCILTQVDSDVVMNFGYLPQEMLGKSVFDFYHPEDLPFMKEVYESMMLKCQIAGSVYRSKPYRFAVQNGDFAMIETEWSCFINPWSRRLEFVTGLHRILQGPSNPNIFETPKEDKHKLASDQVSQAENIIREEILHTLNKELSRPSKLQQQEVTERCKHLAAVMENIIEDVSKPTATSTNIPNRQGQSSPPNEVCDRESSETAPSYTQLNYNDNITRFFKSKPMTNVTDENDRVQRIVELDQARKSPSAVPTFNQVSGRGSTVNCSSESNPNNESGTNTSNSSYEHLLLTEELILRHNEDMEKMMRQKHKELRSSMKTLKCNKIPIKIVEDGCAAETCPQNSERFHGIKRSGSSSWEESYKVLKQKHLVNEKENAAHICGDYMGASSHVGQSHVTNLGGIEKDKVPGINDLRIWPQIQVAMAPLDTNPTIASPLTVQTSGLFPVYYIPTQLPPAADYMESCSLLDHQNQHKRGMLSNPMLCSPVTIVSFPVPQTIVPDDKEASKSSDLYLGRTPSQFQRHLSQAELGSAMDSTVSASFLHRTFDTFEDKFDDITPPDEESSYSSFYSSFFKTDPGSGSNDGSTSETDRKTKNNIANQMLRDKSNSDNCDPIWMQDVNVTPELIYRYQIRSKELDEVLKSDLTAMENVKQSDLVNDQLEELYLSMEMEKMIPVINLQESISSSNSEEDYFNTNKLKKKSTTYTTLTMIYEEHAPLPAPDH